MISQLAASPSIQGFLEGKSLLLVDFYAGWCEPCKWLDEILDVVDKEASFPLHILKIDTEKFPDLALEYGVKSVPVLIVCRNNEVVWRMNGFLNSGDLLEKLAGISRETE